MRGGNIYPTETGKHAVKLLRMMLCCLPLSNTSPTATGEYAVKVLRMMLCCLPLSNIYPTATGEHAVTLLLVLRMLLRCVAYCYAAYHSRCLSCGYTAFPYATHPLPQQVSMRLHCLSSRNIYPTETGEHAVTVLIMLSRCFSCCHGAFPDATYPLPKQVSMRLHCFA